MAYSVVVECSTCIHNKVCNMKQWYEIMQKTIRNVDNVTSDANIQVSIECQHYLRSPYAYAAKVENRKDPCADIEAGIIRSAHNEKGEYCS